MTREGSDVGSNGRAQCILFAFAGVFPLALILWIELAWLAPALAHMPSQETLSRLFLPWVLPECRPEPLESLRYIFLICTVPAFYALWLRLAPREPSSILKAAGLAGQLLVVAFVALLLVAQQEGGFGFVSESDVIQAGVKLLVIALALGALSVVLKNVRLRLWGAFAIVAVFGAFHLLPMIYTTANVSRAFDFYQWHLPFSLDEFASVLNGRTPWVDFFPLYQNLAPYALEPVFRIFGLSVTTFIFCMAGLALLCFFMVFDIFRGFFSKTDLALVATLGFIGVASDPYLTRGSTEVNPLNFQMIPLRVFGPWLLMFLLARYVRGARLPRVRRAILVVAALVALNNLNMGIPALVAAVAAMAAVEKSRPRALAEAALCIAAGVLGVTLLTWLRSGRWPDYGEDWAKLLAYGKYGYTMLPMPALGVHWFFVMTFLAAVIVGWILRERSPVRSAILLYGGIFGAGGFMYYVGRSHPYVLISMFSLWVIPFICLMGLLGESWGTAGPDEKKAWVLPAVACALGMLYFLPIALKFPEPLAQVRRIGSGDESFERKLAVEEETIRGLTVPHEKVIILYPYGHLLAMRAGVDNLSPFTEDEAIVLKSQQRALFDGARAAHVTRLFGRFPGTLAEEAARAGYRRVTEGSDGFDVWSQ